MSHQQPPPDEKRLRLFERRPRRLGDINWREIIDAIAYAGGAYLPIAVYARLFFDSFDDTLLGMVSRSGFLPDVLAVFGAAGVGYVWFLLIGGALTGMTIAVFGLSGTLVRQDWVAGFLGGATALLATAPITLDPRQHPWEYLLGPVLAVLITQAATTYVATRELKKYVRQSFWSADAQILVNRKSMNLQISILAILGATAVASVVLTLLKLSGVLELSIGRLVLSGFLQQLLLLPLCVAGAHWALRDMKVPPLFPKD